MSLKELVKNDGNIVEKDGKYFHICPFCKRERELERDVDYLQLHSRKFHKAMCIAAE